MTKPIPVEIELKLTLPPLQVEAFLKRMARRRGEPVRQSLTTRYYDTPDFVLSAQGVALRVRRAGRRWLQTLKTEGERQGGLSRRAEYEMPVAGRALDWTLFPAEALAHVPDTLREQVVPVFETRFDRTAWLVRGHRGAQIEVALDVGEVRTLKGSRADERSQPICEIELELKSGEPDALFELALQWAEVFDCLPFDISKAERGVRLVHGQDMAPVTAGPLGLDADMSVEDGFAAIVKACLAQFQANLPGVLLPLMEPLAVRLSPQTDKSLVIPNPDGMTKHSIKPASGQVAAYPTGAEEGANVMPNPINDLEYVHQARVALRRLRAALRLMRKGCELPEELMGGLRALAAALGPARDWDVLCGETLPAIAPHYADAAAWQAGMRRLEAHRDEVRAAMRDALMQAHPGVWLLAMQRWLLRREWRAAPEAQRFIQLSPLKAWARRALTKGHRPIARGAREFDTLAPVQRHALRIAIKRQRYAVEFFRPLFTRHRRRQGVYLGAMRRAQDTLGRANDAHNARMLLAAVQEMDIGPMRDFVLGWLAAGQASAGNGESAKSMRTCLKLTPCW